ncbi:MAG: arginine/agmatine antiporter [Parachlamydiales bacterium]|nr:arginine/agmatine antiporter [Parachlamydiales bacterium]
MKEKKLGIVTLTALVTGNMIGSGIFLLPAAMARLGSMTLISWIFTSLGSLFLAFVFARLSQSMPETGGPYAYARMGLGDAFGCQTAYCYWINAWVGNAVIILAGVGYLSVFFPALTDPRFGCMAAIGLVWVFTALNLKGVYAAGIFQLISTISKLIPILFIAICGWFFFHVDYIIESANVSNPPMSTFGVITQGAILTLWAFTGLETATVPADSVDNPKRNIPIATILGTLIASGCYILGSTVIMGMIPNGQLQNSLSPFADAAQILLGNWGKWIIAGGAVISCLGTLNGWIMIQAQIPMAAAHDNLFLKIFARRNKYGAPVNALIISSALVSLLLFLTISPDLINQFKFILLMATLTALISYFYTPIAELILYITGKISLTRGSIIVAILAMLYSFWAITGAGIEVLSYGVLVVLSSIPFYLIVLWRKSKN